MSRKPWAVVAALATLVVAEAARGESFAVNQPPTADRIDFNVDLRPQDPFADANKVDAPRAFRRGEVVRLVIDGAPRPGFHTYPLTKQFEDKKSFINRITYAANDDVQPLYPVTETPPETVDENGGAYLEFKEPFTWTQDFYIKPGAKAGPAHLRFTLHLVVCDQSCMLGNHEFDVPFTVVDGPPVAPPEDLEKLSQFTPPPDETVKVEGKERRVVSVFTVGKTTGPPPSAGVVSVNPPPAGTAAAPAPGGLWGLLVFLGESALGGALSLLTPCVFPMIPITVSYFLKQSEKSSTRGARSPVLMAVVYSATIALVLTLAGVLLVRFVQALSQNWATNAVLGGLFVFFALSLFGMYDIVLPSGLGRLTAAGEGRGGLAGVVFMALTFTVISFACVAPVYGGFLALSASASSAGDWLKLVLGALAFSVTFALPFFVLALFPSLLKALPKSGTWLNTVKVVMGFLELAAAFKFLRAAELNLFAKTEFLTYDLVLGVYIALAVACGLYLLGVYRLPHDHGAHETLSVPRLLFSIAFLGLALYLLPGLFPFTTEDGEPAKPQGAVFAWVDAFLLREKVPPRRPADAAAGRLVWTADLKDALKRAAAEKKLVFLNFTAQVCTNCEYNEGNVFTDPGVKELLRRYVLVDLYTDNVPPGYPSSTTGDENRQFQQDAFVDATLPLYAIIRPKEGGYEKVGRPFPAGKINDVAGFARFLREPLTADAKPLTPNPSPTRGEGS